MFRGNIVDVVNCEIKEGYFEIIDGCIANLGFTGDENPSIPYFLPGLVDAHVHIESSMLIPSEFARLAVLHGTVATVSDPHEIANVLGLEGVKFMLENAEKVNFHFHFGAPSCVPATVFETAGAALNPPEVDDMLSWPAIKYLAEVMNYPGVIARDPDLMAKIQSAISRNKAVDGHAPGVRGLDAKIYFDCGITTDHECFTYEEGLEKAKLGVNILIREGSAAKNFEALIDLIDLYPNQIMLCSDDKHPNDLEIGHINLLVKRALQKGKRFFDVIRSCTHNPTMHYQLNNGLLRNGDSADFIEIDNPDSFHIKQTWIKGINVANTGFGLIKSVEERTPNAFNCAPIQQDQLRLNLNPGKNVAIEILDGQIVTGKFDFAHPGGVFGADLDQDLLKIVVYNRYKKANPAISVVKNSGLKKGAIASSVAHDSHNIVAIGVEDAMICKAINAIIAEKGGLSAVDDNHQKVIGLPVAGLMSNRDGFVVAREYDALDKFAKSELGSELGSPYMSLSFLALLVIPKLKLSDLGLFDVESFSFVS